MAWRYSGGLESRGPHDAGPFRESARDRVVDHRPVEMPEPYHRGQERLARRVLGVAFVLLVVSFLATWLVGHLR